MAVAGRVAIVPKGEWSANATYKRLDAVTHNNTLYFAKKNVPAGTATSNTEYWSKSIAGGASAIATTEDAGVVKPDGKSMSVDESGTLSINLDGTTITLDEAKNVIKLADTLKDKINGAFPAANLINNLTTTEAGFGLDARQGKALYDKITEINGSLEWKQVYVQQSLYEGYEYTLPSEIINANEVKIQVGIATLNHTKQTQSIFKGNVAGFSYIDPGNEGYNFIVSMYLSSTSIKCNGIITNGWITSIVELLNIYYR